jgi:hypothetical protein
MTPIRWGAPSQGLHGTRANPRREIPAFFAAGLRPRYQGLAVGQADSVSEDSSPSLLGRSIRADLRHRALDA